MKKIDLDSVRISVRNASWPSVRRMIPRWQHRNWNPVFYSVRDSAQNSIYTSISNSIYTSISNSICNLVENTTKTEYETH